MITQSSFKYWDRTVEYFDAIYSGDGRTFFGRWLDRWLRRDIYVRVAETARLINELGAGQTVLDIGTGTGRLCVPLARAGHRVIGIDFSREMLTKAERVTREAGVGDRCHFFHADILQSLPEALNDYRPYDAVAILGVFDYISDPLPVLQAARQFEPKRIVASFPRSGTFRSALRQWRYKVQRLDCPLFFYSRAEIEKLGSELHATRTYNSIIGQLHFTYFDF
jgi:ubiquinone/menaquinone biosynthesis C-methylase UbiE